jgi:hypothetical protein
MDDQKNLCPFQVGEMVRFNPSERTLGHYQDIASLGIEPGEAMPVAEIRGGCYLYFAGGVGGWPWTEFVAVS